MPNNPERAALNSQINAYSARQEHDGVDNPDAKRQQRVESLAKRVDGLRSTVEQSKQGNERSLAEKALSDIRMATEKIGAHGKVDPHAAAEALATALDSLRSKAIDALQPSQQLIDDLISIGRANKNNVDPAIQADVQELRTIVVDMRGRIDSQPPSVGGGPMNITINNNLAPQSGPTAPAVAPEKKEEQQGWQQDARSLMEKVASVNGRIQQAKGYKEQRESNGTWTEADQKQFKRAIDDLQYERKQALTTVNAIVEHARKPSPDRKLIAATVEETDMLMKRWLLDLGIKGVSVRNGVYVG